MSTSGSRGRMDGVDISDTIGTTDDLPADTAPAHSAHRSGLAAAASEARFRLAWGLSTRIVPLVYMAGRLFSTGKDDPQKRKGTIPRRWYISHILFWVGSGTACWLQFRRTDRAAAKRHLVRSVWIPPLVWLVALTAVGTAIPDEAILDMVRNAPYNAPPP